MVRFFNKEGKEQSVDDKEKVVDIKEESQPQVVEREINLSLLNEKLNILLNLVSQLLEKKN